MGNGENTEPNNINSLDPFRSSVNTGADKEASRLRAQRIYKEISNIFTCIGCFEGTFKLSVKKSSQPYQAPSCRAAYTLQQPLERELDMLQKQLTLIPLDVDET